jgi:hypothetical protein
VGTLFSTGCSDLIALNSISSPFTAPGGEFLLNSSLKFQPCETIHVPLPSQPTDPAQELIDFPLLILRYKKHARPRHSRHRLPRQSH